MMTPDDLAGFVDEVATAVVERMTGERHERPLYSPKTLAERLAVSERTVRQMLADNVIPSFTVGGARRVEAAAVEEYIRSRQESEEE